MAYKITFENLDEEGNSKYEETIENDFAKIDILLYPIKRGLLSLGYSEKLVDKFLKIDVDK